MSCRNTLRRQLEWDDVPVERRPYRVCPNCRTIYAPYAEPCRCEISMRGAWKGTQRLDNSTVIFMLLSAAIIGFLIGFAIGG